jgi:hypothetical protein
MSRSHDSRAAVPLLVACLLAPSLAAQTQVIALKNWAAPLYWQPNQAEREAAVQASPRKDAPEIVFSSNAVSTAALTLVAITPCRLVDTRGSAAGFAGSTPFSGPSLTAGGSATFPVQSSTEANTTAPTPCGAIPSIAQAYSFNVTVVPHAGGTVYYLSIWPAGSAQPSISTLNDYQGSVVANAAIVPAGTPWGGVSVYNSGPAATDVIIDMNGFYAAPTDLSGNTAIGMDALASSSPGGNNTASGALALELNTGNSNTASGAYALAANTAGNLNTASGANALQDNNTGGDNTASGAFALQNNTSGGDNTASGAHALLNNTQGGWNTATGESALKGNTTGNDNTASGYDALSANTLGCCNTASGANALVGNVTGGYNVAIGYQAGYNVTGSNNIDIGNQGTSSDSGAIRIGTPGTQTSFFAAGVRGVSTGQSNAIEVMIDSNGQLGTVSSSRRFKEDIADMGDASAGLLELRPVTFRYKKAYADGSKPLDYGLIAEEVAEVYPDLVVRGRDGQVETVQYQKLTPMLLNELQKQSQDVLKQDATIGQQEDQIRAQEEQIRQQQEQNRQQQAEIRKLESRLAALEELLRGKDVAMAPAGQ